jgi:hypothetical protein
MKTAGSSKTFVNIYQITWRQKSEDDSLHTDHRQYLNLTYLEQEAYLAFRDGKYKKHGELRRFKINIPLQYY